MTSSPTSPSRHRRARRRRRRPGPSRPAAARCRTGPVPSSRARAGDHGGLGRAVGVPHLAARRRASRSASSGGQASPPKISSRTASSASAGHSAASVGTVETTVMPLGDQPRARGPCRCAPASAAPAPGRRRAARPATSPRRRRRRRPTARPAPGRRARAGRPAGTSGPRRRRTRRRERWVTATPFGVPVDPEVKMIQASSSARRAAPAPVSRAAPGAASLTLSSLMTAATSASPKTSRGPLLGVVGVDRHVGGADRQGRQDGDVELGVPDGIRMPMRSPGPTPAARSARPSRRPPAAVPHSSASARRRPGRGVRVVRRTCSKDVHESAGCAESSLPGYCGRNPGVVVSWWEMLGVDSTVAFLKWCSDFPLRGGPGRWSPTLNRWHTDQVSATARPAHTGLP